MGGVGKTELAIQYQRNLQLLGESHRDVASSLNNLASLYDSMGRYEKAEPLYLQALEICKRMLGDNHPTTVTVRGNLVLLQEKLNPPSK